MQVQVGCGAAPITPPLGVRIAGYFSERLATDVHDDLFVKALAFRGGETTVLLLCFDLICLGADHVRQIRDAVTTATGVPGNAVMVSATHTHTGGATRGKWVDGHPASAAWVETLPQRAGEAAKAAVDSLEPCRASWGRSAEDLIAFNRRYRMKNGMVMSNPGLRNPDILEPAGPIDPDVTTVAFRRSDGSCKALLVHYTCHLDNVGGTEISADYPGHLTRRLQERLPDRPFVFYLQGACGDINHVDTRSSVGRKGHEHSRWMGETLAGDVCVALSSPETLDLAPVTVASCPVELPVRKDADPEAGKAEVQAIRLGDLGVVGVPAEYFVELQLDIKRRSPLPVTLVGELTNGWIGYIPTRKAFEENMQDVPAEAMSGFDHRGYEVRSALSRGLLPGCGERLADAAVEMLAQATKEGQ